MPEDIKPVVIPPGQLPDTAKQPDGYFVLHDYMFPLEDPEKFPLEDDGAGPLRTPHFSVGDVLAWVLAKPKYFLKNPFRDTGGDIPGFTFHHLARGRRGSVNHRGERRLTLPDIERFVWRLHELGLITGIELQNAMEIVIAVARQYGAEFVVKYPKDS
jgi:hypothetical protein